MITIPFDQRWYGGAGVTQTVSQGTQTAGQFPVAINGHNYIAVMNNNQLFGQHFHESSIATVRTQADTSSNPAEATLNPEGLWRRAQDDFAEGAGQTFFDRPTSNSLQYRTSKGVTPWNKWHLSLLPDTSKKRTSTSSNLFLLPVGSYLYLSDGQNLYYTQDITVTNPTWTQVTGGAAANITRLASDGSNIWVAYGGSGLYSTTRGAAALTSGYFTGSPTINTVGYVKGRLLVTSGASLYNVIAASGSALPSPMFTRAPVNSDFTWVGFAEGPGQIYFAGFSGDQSYIYRTQVTSDGTQLSAPVVAGVLPSGELISGIQGYSGFLILGTSKGVRLAQPDSNGNLTVGSLISTSSSVQCFSPFDRFVWFGWSNYDVTSTGLGRLDLSVFPEPLQAAYASDSMATAQGAVLSVATFQNIRVFTVAGVGVFAETTSLVASGSFQTGTITYGLPDNKVAMYLDLVTEPLAGSVSGAVATDGGSFVPVGTDNATGSVTSTFAVGQTRGRTHEVQLTLNRSATDLTKGPTVDRWTLRSYPAPSVGREWVVPLLLHEELNVDGGTTPLDVIGERAYLEGLYDSHQLVNYQMGGETFTVFVDDFQWLPHHQTLDHRGWNGTMVLVLKFLPA